MTKTTMQRPTTTQSDPWDDDCWDDADDAKTSWVKSYEGGIKHRKYIGN
jgi:hypothetical protein